MYIQLNVETIFEINSLADLATYKKVMEHLKMKINKSKLELTRFNGTDIDSRVENVNIKMLEIGI